MNISKFTDYSFRVMIYLAIVKPERATVDELATSLLVSRNHLVKVVHFLTSKGFLKSSRGRKGGIWLDRDPASISLDEIFQATEKLCLVDCLDTGVSNCPICLSCRLRTVFQRAGMNLLEYLSEYTLQDIARYEFTVQELPTVGVESEVTFAEGEVKF